MSGRYGPYVKWGRVNATLPEGHNPETISLAEAVALIDSKAKKAPAKRSAKKSAVKRSGKVIPAEADA
jgi:DNA topoisomerase-1